MGQEHAGDPVLAHDELADLGIGDELCAIEAPLGPWIRIADIARSSAAVLRYESGTHGSTRHHPTTTNINASRGLIAWLLSCSFVDIAHLLIDLLPRRV